MGIESKTAPVFPLSLFENMHQHDEVQFTGPDWCAHTDILTKELLRAKEAQMKQIHLHKLYIC